MSATLEIDFRRDEEAKMKWVCTRYRDTSTSSPKWTKTLYDPKEASWLQYEPTEDELLPPWKNPERAMAVLLLRAEAGKKEKNDSQQLGLKRCLVQALFDVVRHSTASGQQDWIQQMFATENIRGPILQVQGGPSGRLTVSFGPILKKCKVNFYLFHDARGTAKSIIKHTNELIQKADEIEENATPSRSHANRADLAYTTDKPYLKYGVSDSDPPDPSNDLRIPAPPPLTALDSIFERSGLLSIFKIPAHNSSRAQRVRAIIAAEALQKDPHFCLLGSSGRSYLHPAGAVWSECGLREALKKKGSKMNVVVQSPFTEFGHARALACNVRHHHWEESLGIGVLKNKARHPKIHIRVSQLPINCSLFITRRSVLYDPYLWACPAEEERIENHFWVFEFQPVGTDARDSYSLLVKHFQFLFDHSLSLDRFLKMDGGHEKQTTEFPHKLRNPRYGSPRSHAW